MYMYPDVPSEVDCLFERRSEGGVACLGEPLVFTNDSWQADMRDMARTCR